MDKGKIWNGMSRVLCGIFAMVLVLMAAGQVKAAESDGISRVTSQPYNVMLLIDKSGSMNATDRPRLALSAGCQFVDQLCTNYSDRSQIVKVGVMAFSQTTEVVSPLLSLDSEENTNFLKSEIRKIEYLPVNTGGTDLGMAVHDAAEALLSQNRDGSRNMIVMFTDGCSENVLDSQASASALDEAYKMAEELDSEIFIVGLNADDRIDPKGQQEIFRIADTAQKGEGILDKEKEDSFAVGESVNYKITDNMGDVREFYIRIYAGMFQSELEFLDNHEFFITSGGILEADVTVYSDTEIGKIEVIDPDGKVLEEDGKKYFVTGDSYYKVLRIMEPGMGTWHVNVTSGDENYKTYVIRFYGIEAAVNAVWGEGKDFPDAGLDAEQIGQVTVIPMLKDQPYQDPSFAEGLTQTEFMVSRKEEPEEEGTFSLHYDKENGRFTGYFPVTGGEYHITAVLAGNGMNRTVECDLTVNSDNESQMPDSCDLGVLHVKNGKKETVDVESLTGTDNLVIQSAITESSLEEEPKDVISTITCDGGMITLYGKHVGSDKLKLEVVDGNGNEYELTGQIEVEFQMLWYYYVFAAVVLLFLIFLLWAISGRLVYVPGEFEITVEADGHTLERDVIHYPRGKKFSLWKLMKRIIQECHAQPDISKEEAAICDFLENKQKEIAKERLVVSKRREKRRKTYQLLTCRSGMKKRKDLNKNCNCYNSEGMIIMLKFTSVYDTEESGDDLWGKAVDNPLKKGKIRTSSRKKTSIDEW